MSEKVFKYHGLGNDFVVLDRRQTGRDITAAAARAVCDRRRGVGADGVLVLLPSPAASARMVVHNSDGSTAEMCGNGLRCVVKYLVDHATEKPAVVPVETGAGVLTCAVTYDRGEVVLVEVDMGPARLVAPNLPPGPFVDQEIPGHPGLRGTAVNMGNPHLVLFGRPGSEAATLGPVLERHPLFLERTNVELVTLPAQVPEGEVDVVVWERGAGLTEACGTGACAALAAGVYLGRLPADQWIGVRLPGGPLDVRVARDLSAVQLRGPAEFVFEATAPPWVEAALR